MTRSTRHNPARARQQAARATLTVVLCAALSLSGSALAEQSKPHAKPSVPSLRQSFVTPPDASRPMVRWWWFGVAVEKPEILRELQQMKADGIGGAELAFVYPEVLDDPARGLENLPFLSPRMLDAVTFAQAEGRKLGLRMDVTLCSGWPYGGPDTPLAEAAGRLRTVEVPAPANATSIAVPKLAEGESFLSVSIANGDPKHWDVASAGPLRGPITGSTLAIAPNPAARTVLFFISSHTRQQVKRAAVRAEGYVLDPFSHQAVATHLQAVGEPLVKAFGATPPYAIFSDSLEAYGADWTPTLPEEFRKRNGYDLIPHLPELVAGGTPAADTIRHDYGRTLTALVDRNYLTQINAWAAAHHTKFRSQTYGEPAVSLASQRLVDLPEGEGPQWRTFSTLRWATSANHLFGNIVSSGETYTWLHSPVFRATPLDMKAEADIDFIMGENQLIFHGWPYSPPQASAHGEPGWSLYAAAVFNDHNPWHPVMPAVTQYIARISSLLRQGSPANQVAVLLPTDDAWASFAPGKVTVTGAMQHLIPPALVGSILSAGYNYDFIDADTVNRLGIHHPVLVLPPTDRIPLETLRKISAYVAAGGKVIAVGRAPSIDPEGKTLDQLSTLSHHLFDPAKSTLIPAPSTLDQALHHAAPPDLALTDIQGTSRDDIGFIRRKLRDTDIYFIVNTSNHPATFTATMATTHRFAETWDTDTAAASPVLPSSQQLSLAPYESRIFLFSEHGAHPFPPHATPAPDPLDLSKDWKVDFPSINKSVTESTLTDWTADPATLHYSGEAVYSRAFTLATPLTGPAFLQVDGGTPIAMPSSPKPSAEETQRAAGSPMPNPLVTRTGPGMHAWFDPPIHEAALVTVNGEPAGALWHPPYRLDVTKLLKPGRNSIEIHVYNTALNAWSALPPHDYKPLIQKYGDRFQMQDLDKVAPISSGLLGPIQLVFGER